MQGPFPADSPLHSHEETDSAVRGASIALPDTTLPAEDAAKAVRGRRRATNRLSSVEFKSPRSEETVRTGLRESFKKAEVDRVQDWWTSGGLCRGFCRGSGQGKQEAQSMAVTLTSAALATAIKKPLEVAERLLPVASILVERYAPNAPTEIQNEATIRCSGFLANQPASACSRDQVALPGGISQVFAFRPSSGSFARVGGDERC